MDEEIKEFNNLFLDMFDSHNKSFDWSKLESLDTVFIFDNISVQDTQNQNTHGVSEGTMVIDIENRFFQFDYLILNAEYIEHFYEPCEVYPYETTVVKTDYRDYK